MTALDSHESSSPPDCDERKTTQTWTLYVCPICGHHKTKPHDRNGAPGTCQQQGHTAAYRKITVAEIDGHA